MAELRVQSKPVFRVGVYSASAGESAGRTFDVPQEAFDAFLKLAEQKLGARLYAEYLAEWIRVAE